MVRGDIPHHPYYHPDAYEPRPPHARRQPWMERGTVSNQTRDVYLGGGLQGSYIHGDSETLISKLRTMA